MGAKQGPTQHLCMLQPYLMHVLLQTQMDQLAEAATKINKLITKLEQTKQQLERAQKEIKDLKEAAQVRDPDSNHFMSSVSLLACAMLQGSNVPHHLWMKFCQHIH